MRSHCTRIQIERPETLRDRFVVSSRQKEHIRHSRGNHSRLWRDVTSPFDLYNRFIVAAHSRETVRIPAMRDLKLLVAAELLFAARVQRPPSHDRNAA